MDVSNSGAACGVQKFLPSLACASFTFLVERTVRTADLHPGGDRNSPRHAIDLMVSEKQTPLC